LSYLCVRRSRTGAATGGWVAARRL